MMAEGRRMNDDDDLTTLQQTHLKMIEQLNGEYASLQLQYEELLTKNIDLQTRLAAIK